MHSFQLRGFAPFFYYLTNIILKNIIIKIKRSGYDDAKSSTVDFQLKSILALNNKSEILITIRFYNYYD